MMVRNARPDALARRTLRRRRWNSLRRNWVLHAMVWPALILLFVFCYVPMGGIIMAFQEFKPGLGFLKSPWVGLRQFAFLFSYDKFLLVLRNTLVLSLSKYVLNIVVPFGFAILLNEVRLKRFKRTVQTMVYLPYFLSWVTLAGILLDILATKGLANQILNGLGLKSVLFLGNGEWFRITVILSDVWKNFGFNTIIYLAALTTVSPELYESAEIDGADRFRQILSITLPSMLPITAVVATLALGGLLNANFDQIFNLYSPLVYEQGDIIDTFVYRIGLIAGKYSLGAAVGLFKSLIGLILIGVSYKLAYRYTSYRIF